MRDGTTGRLGGAVPWWIWGRVGCAGCFLRMRRSARAETEEESSSELQYGYREVHKQTDQIEKRTWWIGNCKTVGRLTEHVDD